MLNLINKIKSINVIDTLKAIDTKIDAADAKYMDTCQKTQDKCVDETVATYNKAVPLVKPMITTTYNKVAFVVLPLSDD